MRARSISTVGGSPQPRPPGRGALDNTQRHCYVDGIPLTFSPQQPTRPPTAPSLSIVAQSGGLSSILRTALIARDVPVAFAVSTGNEAVLGLEDYLAFLLDDAMTRVITVFAEQIRRPQRFLALAARAREAGKAIVLLHRGGSASARAGALFHHR